jgi:hypothetical protein
MFIAICGSSPGRRPERSGKPGRDAAEDQPSTAVARFNWEEAARRDYVAKHGSVPFWVGLGSDEDPAEAVEVALRLRLQATLDLVKDYAMLAPFEQQRQYDAFYWRLCDRFDDERHRLGREDEKLSQAIDEYESGLLSLLAGLRPRP